MLKAAFVVVSLLLAAYCWTAPGAGYVLALAWWLLLTFVAAGRDRSPLIPGLSILLLHSICYLRFVGPEGLILLVDFASLFVIVPILVGTRWCLEKPFPLRKAFRFAVISSPLLAWLIYPLLDLVRHFTAIPYPH